MKRNSKKGVLAVGVIVGGLAGALIGLLIAPKKGSETRADMKVRTTALRSSAGDMASRGRSHAGERASAGIAAVRERAGPIYADVRERIAPIFGENRSQANDARREGTEGDESESRERARSD